MSQRAEGRERRFSGQRLRVARSFNGLTRAQLGALISVTPQYIGHLENGRKQPTQVLADAASSVLGFEEEFFFGGDLEEFQDEECHFRRRTTTPVSVRNRVLAHGSLFGALVSYLDSMVSMPQENVPVVRFDSPDDIERAADRYRMAWGLGVDLPIKNLVRAVERAGVVVTRFEADTVKIDAFSRAGHRSVVVLNAEKDSFYRSRFDLAHECGHLAAHGGVTTGDAETEGQANRFAGALLLPRAGFVREFPRSASLDWDRLLALKERWGASLSAIVRRAYELRLIPATVYQAAYKHMAYRGWLKKEPGDERSPEEPELVLLCLSEIERTFSISGTDVAKLLGWTSENFTIVSGVPLMIQPPPEPSGKLISLKHERIKRLA